MKKLPITIMLFTTTKGHFDRTDIYQKTITEFLKQASGSYFKSLKANIKSEDHAKANEMKSWLEEKGFNVLIREGKWKHGESSHQLEFLQDIFVNTSLTETPYILFLEDDWIFKSENNKPLVDWISESISILEEHPEVVQVRFPRFSNEAERILKLKEKHNIDGIVVPNEDGSFYQNDWSNNPYIARTRDLNAAIRFVLLSNLPKHSEHGLGQAMKMLSSSPAPFVCFNPEKVRVGHIGVASPEQEDNLNNPLLSF